MFNKKGFLSLEQALLIGVLIAAMIAMSVYFKRALSGKYRQAGDTFGQGRQYQP
jgi:hypothetical protein